jgi:hypothetical protein
MGEKFDDLGFPQQLLGKRLITELVHLFLQVLGQDQQLNGFIVDLFLPKCIGGIEVVLRPCLGGS